MALDSVAVITQVFIQNNTVYLIFIFYSSVHLQCHIFNAV